MAHDVFICHSSKDRTLANAVCSTLEQHRIRCWIAPRDVLPGSDYAQSIVEAIGSTRLTVLVFSDNSNHSGHVRREIERSVSHGVPILPFRVEDVVPSPSLEYFISDAHWLDAMTPPVEQHLDHLAETVRLLLERQDSSLAPLSTAVPAPVTAVPPPASPSATPASASPPLARRGRSRLLWLALGAGVLVVALVVGLLLLGGDDTAPSSVGPKPSATTGATASATTDTSGVATTPAPDAAAGVVNEEFLGALDPGWTWVNEDRARWTLDAEPGWLEITAQSSPPIRNLLLRDTASAGEDYSVETFLKFNPTSDFQFAGLVITGPTPDSDRLQLGRAHCTDTVCVGDGLYFDRVKAGSFVGDNHAVKLGSDVQYVLLGLDVSDNQVTARYSLDEGKTWPKLGTHPLDPGYTRIGILAHNAPQPITAGFEAFYVYP